MELANLVSMADIAISQTPEELGLFAYLTQQIDPSVSWKDVEWLQSISTLREHLTNRILLYLEKKQYRMKRLCEIINHNWQHSAQEIKQAVIDDVRKFIGEQKVFNDITLVVLKQ